jgi:hypothetical protein
MLLDREQRAVMSCVAVGVALPIQEPLGNENLERGSSTKSIFRRLGDG